MISTENYVVTFEMSGEELLAALNDPPFGALWQVSGLRYHYDPKREAGSQVTAVEILDEASGAYLPLDTDSSYTVACNSYLTDGTSRCGAMAKAAPAYENTNRQLVVIVGEYIGAHSPVSLPEDDRIVVDK
jgi:2',3'-cyclic-nucleotide 2'-phosphodiesterase (5'-nucleotidase family)